MLQSFIFCILFLQSFASNQYLFANLFLVYLEIIQERKLIVRQEVALVDLERLDQEDYE